MTNLESYEVDGVEETKLKPCPFCGGEAKFESGIEVIPAYDKNGAYVDAEDIIYYERTGCPKCGIWFDFWDEGEEGDTIKKWNARATAPSKSKENQ